MGHRIYQGNFARTSSYPTEVLLKKQATWFNNYTQWWKYMMQWLHVNCLVLAPNEFNVFLNVVKSGCPLLKLSRDLLKLAQFQLKLARTLLKLTRVLLKLARVFMKLPQGVDTV